MNNSEFGKLIKTARQQKGYTQSQLADILSVSTSAVSKWENGKNLPDNQILVSLANALSLTIEELYHPLETANRLTDGTISKSETVSETTITTSHKKKKGLLQPKSLLISSIIFLLLAIIAGIITYKSFFGDSESSIVQVAFRTTEDEICGPVYEVACVVQGKNMDDIDLEDSFVSSLSNFWQNDDSIPSNITIMKISFYSEEKQAVSWNIPEKSIYIVR